MCYPDWSRKSLQVPDSICSFKSQRSWHLVRIPIYNVRDIIHWQQGCSCSDYPGIVLLLNVLPGTKGRGKNWTEEHRNHYQGLPRSIKSVSLSKCTMWWRTRVSNRGPIVQQTMRPVHSCTRAFLSDCGRSSQSWYHRLWARSLQRHLPRVSNDLSLASLPPAFAVIDFQQSW